MDSLTSLDTLLAISAIPSPRAVWVSTLDSVWKGLDARVVASNSFTDCGSEAPSSYDVRSTCTVDLVPVTGLTSAFSGDLSDILRKACVRRFLRYRSLLKTIVLTAIDQRIRTVNTKTRMAAKRRMYGARNP